MALNINGTTGISGVDGSASAPALKGTDSNTGVSFGTDTVNINTGGTTRATIDSSGNLGLGTESPTAVTNSKGLTIKGSAGNLSGFVDFRDSSNNNDARIHADNGQLFIECDVANQTSGSRIAFLLDGTEEVRILPNDFGIGGFAFGNRFTVVSQDGQSTGFFRKLGTGNQRTVGIQNYRATGSSSGSQIEFFDADGNKRGSVVSNNSTTAYNTSSDYRLKENEVLISDGITRLKTLKPYRFNWKNRPSETVDGFFAHEVKDAVPEAIYGEKDKIVNQADIDNKDFSEEEYNVGDPVYQEMDQSKLVPLLTAALQEAVAKIEVLETKVAALEAA